MTGLDRLLRPKTIAVIGGGAWCRNVIQACEGMGFEGQIWPVHPSNPEIAGKTTYPTIEDLPTPPDASFIGVNRYATIACLSSLSKRGAGGAVCFASGFAEAAAELADGADLQSQLLAAAGDMCFLGPNCYGFLNYLDGAALWPDQHGGVPVETGVAIVTQSSNIAINLTMQSRGLPLAYAITAGNQANTDIAEIGMELLRDPRVTCLGLHIEGINNIRLLEDLSHLSHELDKPVCVLKVGASEQAQIATISHTASMAGSQVGASALLDRLGIAQPRNLASFLELLKIWHVAGPLSSNRLASASCSGGEASLMADLGLASGLSYPKLSEQQSSALRTALGPKVALANPLDYHTYIWGDKNAMRDTFAALFDADVALGVIVLDFPRTDRCDHADWAVALDAISQTAKLSAVPVAVLASLPETMPEQISSQLIRNGIIPLNGMDHALEAIALAHIEPAAVSPILLPITPLSPQMLSENEAKAALAKHGVCIPLSKTSDTVDGIAKQAEQLNAPYVLKGLGLAHKTEAGAVRVGLTDPQAVHTAAKSIKCDGYLVEEMVENTIAELLLSVTLDPAHGFVLTIGAGGTLTEIFQDTAALLLPVSKEDILKAIASLRLAPVLAGYRGAAAIDPEALWNTVEALQNYVLAHHGQLQEVEINPLICAATACIAVDALIMLGDRP